MTQHEDAQKWFESVREDLSNPYTSEAWIRNQKEQHDAVEAAMTALMKDKKKKLDVKSKEMAAYKLRHDYIQQCQDLVEGYTTQQQYKRPVTVEEAQRAAEVELDRVRDWWDERSAPGYKYVYERVDPITGYSSRGVPSTDLEMRIEDAERMKRLYMDRYSKGEQTDEVKAAMAYWTKFRIDISGENARMIEEFNQKWPPPPPPPPPKTKADEIYEKLEYPDWTYLTIAAAGILAIALFL